MFRCNHTAVVSSWMVSLSHTNTHTNTSLLPAQRTAYILAKDILKNALFPTYIDIYIYNFFCVCKFIVRALFVLNCSSEEPLHIHPPFAVSVAICWETLLEGVACCLSQMVAPARWKMWGSRSMGLPLALPPKRCFGG